MTGQIPTTGNRTSLAPSIKSFLDANPDLHLGGREDFHAERRHHLQVFGYHALADELKTRVGHLAFTAVRTRHGTVPLRIFYPHSAVQKGEGHSARVCADRKLPALVYFHGGGYTVGSVDEFENGLRLLAEKADIITIGVDYHLAPEHPFPTQLDEYADILGWAQSPESSSHGIDGARILGGGDSAGGNMTAALALRLKDEGKPQLKAQILLYPEARLPFDTPAATENNSGYYLECNGIFSFADHYLPRAPEKAVPPSHRYVSPGMQEIEDLDGLPPAAVFTCGFDPLRDVGVEYASKLQKAGNAVAWKHFPDLTHGFLQLAPWSKEAMAAVDEVARATRELAYA